MKFSPSQYSAQWDKKVEPLKHEPIGEQQIDDEPTKVKFLSVVKKVVKVLEQRSDEKKLPSDKSKSLYAIMHRSITSFFYRNIFIVANVFMMIWSIAYHSWFGFILLVWANLIWIKKDQRESMMKSSPFLVVYAIALLVIQYVSGMGFTDAELSQNLGEIISRQIIKNDAHASLHLLFKSFLTVPFWLTMRMYLQERVIRAHKQTLKFEENVLKLVRENRLRRSEDGIFTRIFLVLKKTCMYSLMWLIILMLFIIAAIGDDKMTIFRIINMLFCFVFILLFQLSFTLWLKSMFLVSFEGFAQLTRNLLSFLSVLEFSEHIRDGRAVHNIRIPVRLLHAVHGAVGCRSKEVRRRSAVLEAFVVHNCHHPDGHSDAHISLEIHDEFGEIGEACSQ